MRVSGKNTVAEVQYLDNDDQLGAYFASVAGGTLGTYEGNYKKFSVTVADGRNKISPNDLDSRGFTLAKQQSGVADFYSDVEVKSTYESEVKALVLAKTGAVRVEIFDHTRRAPTEKLRKEKKLREVASVIHNDYTETSGPKRLREIFPEEADGMLESRFAIINVWRSINGSIHNHPLALCHASSVSPTDLVAVQRKSADRIGEIQLALHNSKHQWFYYPDMGIDEAILFKTYDSATDGRTRFTIHTSFDDPNAAVDAPARESMETRCFVFY